MTGVRPTFSQRLASRAPRAVVASSERTWWHQNLEQSLPILVTGVALVGAASWLGLTSPHAAAGHLPLWPLVLAIGLILLGCGVALTLVDESELPAYDGPEYIRVNRAEWDRLHGGGPVAEPWDESSTTTPELVTTAAAGERAAAPGVAASPAAEADDMVRELADLLASTPASSPSGSGAAAPNATPIASPPMADVSPSPSLTRPVAPQVPAPRRAADPIPVWAEPTGPSTTTPPRPETRECAGCGEPTESWAEACVTCDRPLCGDCQNESFSEGRPGLCPSCDRTRRSIEPGSG